MEDSKLLGPVIKAWFKANEWPQSVSEGLARAKGWTAGPWASQISICMAGRLTPKPNFFLSLGMFNQAVAERDFIGVTDRRLMDRLKAGQPICHEDGVPWDAMDFFGCYIGAVKPPKSLSKPTYEITAEDAEELTRGLREGFREVVLQAMDPGGPIAVWNRIAKRALENGMAPEDADFAQEVVSGIKSCSLEAHQRFAIKYPCCPVIEAMQAELQAMGGTSNRLEMFYEWHKTLHPAQI